MIGIINYGAGNIFSLTAALKRLDLAYGMVNSKDNLAAYNHIIIPGVGHAGAAMQKLRETGMVDAILDLKVPVLGICVGMQLLSGFSEEGASKLLNLVPINTLHFKNRIQRKVPHMGWNKITLTYPDPLFQHIENDTYFYFVHSYYLEYNPTFTLAFTAYDISFSAAIKYRNFYGVQFHPEKSGAAGEQLLRNFSLL